MANALDLIYGRRPSIRNGKLAGFRTTPGASQSPRDSMVNLTGGVGARPLTGGLSSSGTWDSFFKPTAAATAAPQSSLFYKPRAEIRSLAPEAPTDVADMASAMDEGSFFNDDEQPTTADGYLNRAKGAAEQYFTSKGIAPPSSFGKPLPSSFSARGPAAQVPDYAERLRRLTSTSFDDDLML